MTVATFYLPISRVETVSIERS